MYAFWRGKSLSPLQVADSILGWFYLQRKTPRCLFLSFLLLFSSNDRPYSGSMAPVTCPLYLSTPFHCYMLCREHTIVLSSYTAPRIPRLSLPYTGQILQLYFVRGLKHWSDIPYMDPSMLSHIREWDVLATCRQTFGILLPLFTICITKCSALQAFWTMEFTWSTQLKSRWMMIPTYLQGLTSGIIWSLRE
jgi:hypothetical protein